MVDIMQVVKFLECLGLLIKDLTQTTEMKQTKRKWISWYVIRQISQIMGEQV